MIFLPAGILQQQIGGGPLLYDTFTESDGTYIDNANHTPDIDVTGGGWVPDRVGQTVHRVYSNRARQYGSYASKHDCDQSDVLVEGVVRTGEDGVTLGLCLRMDTSTYNQFFYAGPSNWFDEFRISEKSGGSYVRASTSVTIANDTNYTVWYEATGTSHTARLDGGNELTYTSSAKQSNTGVGIYGHTYNHVDEITVTAV